jgi:hypothetical protein
MLTSLVANPKLGAGCLLLAHAVLAGCDEMAAVGGRIGDSHRALSAPTLGDRPDPFIVAAESPEERPTLPASPSRNAAAPELPREYLATGMPAVTGRSIRVPAGSNLQAAVEAAELGDELVLDAGATYTGTLTLPKKAGSGWLIIRSSGSLPAEGVRVTPADAPRLARLVATRASERVIQTEPGAHHYRLIGLEITAQAGATQGGTLVELGDGSAPQTTVASQPHHLVLDRVYIHGTPTLSFQRCVALQSASTAIIDSWLSECHGKGFDSQAIGGWNGTGPYKIVNNHLAGAGENVMFGGADPKIPGAVPSDIEIRRNHFVKPLAWQGVWSVKNLLEFKLGRRVLIEGNVFENSWADAQTGFAIKMKSVNQSGGAPWSETSDITFRYNIVRNTAHGAGIAANPEAHPAVPTTRVLFEHNIFDRIGTDADGFGGGRLFQIGGVDDLTIAHNTAISRHSALLLLNAGPSHRLTVTNNIFSATPEGVTADGGGSGLLALDARAPHWVFAGNILAGVNASRYPTGNSYPTRTEDIGFADLFGGDLSLRGQVETTAGADIALVRAKTANVVK